MFDTIPLILNTDPFYEKSLKISLNGFIFKFNNKEYIITLNHNLPVKSIEYNNSLVNIKINSNWSEILILDFPNNLIDYKIHKIYQNKLPLVNQILKIKSTLINYNLIVTGYDFIPFDNLPNSSKTIFIKAQIETNDILTEYIGYPIYMNDILVGIMSKWNHKTSTVYIIPFYIVIKNLTKYDNNSIYLINESIKLKKIGYYNIKENNMIYHRTLKYYIPIDSFMLLEGDGQININFLSELNENFNWDSIKKHIIYDTNIIKTNNLYKITNKLLTLLNKLNIDKRTLMSLLNKFINESSHTFYIDRNLMII